MAAKLVKYYQLIQELGGLKAKMRMAMLTTVPSVLAGDLPDSPGNIVKFRTAYKEITGKEAPPV